MPRRVEKDDEAPVEAAEKRAAEDWALAKGFLPQFVAAAAPFAAAGVAPLQELNPNYWRFAAAKAVWPIGKELTEDEFDRAVSLETLNAHSFR